MIFNSESALQELINNHEGKDHYLHHLCTWGQAYALKEMTEAEFNTHFAQFERAYLHKIDIPRGNEMLRREHGKTFQRVYRGRKILTE